MYMFNNFIFTSFAPSYFLRIIGNILIAGLLTTSISIETQPCRVTQICELAAHKKFGNALSNFKAILSSQHPANSDSTSVLPGPNHVQMVVCHSKLDRHRHAKQHCADTMR